MYRRDEGELVLEVFGRFQDVVEDLQDRVSVKNPPE